MANRSSDGPEDGQPQRKAGWIGDLARRSTGLRGDEKRAAEDRSGDRSLWSLAGLGIQFGASVAVFAYLGYALDRWKGWSPWGVVSLTLLAVMGNLYLLVKQGMMEEKSEVRSRKSEIKK